MELLFICVKIFFARILDVTISTFRQNIMLKGKIVISTILAFFEILIWFLVAREALVIAIDSIFIPISYSLGYATGTLIGAILSQKLIKGVIGVQIITDEDKKELINLVNKFLKPNEKDYQKDWVYQSDFVSKMKENGVIPSKEYVHNHSNQSHQTVTRG